MKKRLFYLAMAATTVLIGMTACHSDEAEDEVPDFPDTPAEVEPGGENLQCDVPVFVSESLNQEVRTAMQEYLSNITSLAEASVAVITPDELGSYDGALMHLYDFGGLVVIVRPTGLDFDEFNEKYDFFDSMPFDATQEVLLFATDNTGRSYVLYANGPAEDQDSGEYYRLRIINFFRWIKHQHEDEETRATRAATVVDLRKESIGKNEGQWICQNFEVSLDKAVYKNGNTHYDLTANGSIDVNYHIMPVYSYAMNGGENADYYIVETDITAHNGEMFTPCVSKGAAGQVFIGGYFMKELDIMSRMTIPTMTSPVAYTYMAEPTPIQSSFSSFQSWYQLELRGPLSYGQGLRDGEVGYTCNITGSKDWETDHIEIGHERLDENPVKFQYHVNDIDFSNAPTNYEYLNAAIPAVARQDFTTHQAWVWKVSPDNKGVCDNGSARFAITTDIGMTYGSYYYRLLKDKGQNNHGISAIKSTVNINAPDRTPFGIIELKNNHKASMTYFSVWQTDDEGFPMTPCTIPVTSIDAGKTASFALAEGTYKIEYAVFDNDSQSIDCYMEKKGIVVKSAKKEGDATTSLTSDDFSVMPAQFPGLLPYTDGGNPLDK